MEQSKTFIPGMENEMNDLYSRESAHGQKPMNGTIIPGVDYGTDVYDRPVIDNKPVSSGVPVVGFLYSLSRQGVGEFWPLHIGTNTIGRSSTCDIQLKEMTVSEHHANIYVRQMKSTGKLIASVQDKGSKTGMYVNDEELDFENHPCKNEDILTVGSNYKLLVVLIDANHYGLTKAEEFVPVIEEPVVKEEPVMGGGRQKQVRIDDGTINLNGVIDSANPGETRFM